jgi:alkaline phosphatase D
LLPARWYWYRFTAAGARSAVGRTRTAPAPGDAVASLDFAITSCQRWDHGHFAAWRDVAAQPLDLVLFLGDYIYEYASGANAVRPTGSGYVQTLADFRNRYALYKSDPLLQAAHAACPWITIWDDHEVDNDYANAQGQMLQSDFLARRAAAYQAWWEFMPVPHSLRPNGPHARIQGRLDWGRLARLQWVDDRQFRDVQACPRPGRGGSNTVRLRDCPALADPSRSLLGAEQEQWLAQGWSLDRPWNLLAQQTLMARFSREPVVDAAQDGRYWTDGWDGYPHARQRLLQAVADRKLPGAVVLGGDVHAHYVADLRVNFEDEKSPPVATEFCGTSISTNGSPQAAVNAALPHNPHIRYGRSDQRGSMVFRLTPERLTADLRAVAEPKVAASTVASSARFVVEAGRPGAQAA